MRRVKYAVLLLTMLVTSAIGGAAPRRLVYPKFYEGPSTHAVVDGPSHDGKEIQVDLPFSQHVKNFGAPKDGLGLCVFASMTMCARWHNVRDLFDVIHQIEEGGGYPSKVDAVLKRYAPRLKYVQYEGTDPAILDKALSEGRAACVTYGYGERYTSTGKMETIYHMVMLVHIDDKDAVILDNNFPGTYEWMTRDEFLRRWVHPSGQGWAYVFLAPPPPPVPHN
jgi:hypothetical protein